ncbi:hypothetical protein P5V15_014028 [Pogonomyrmex californicus]
MQLYQNIFKKVNIFTGIIRIFITRQERLVLQELNKDTDVIVLSADKGNTTSDYKRKIKTLLSNKTYSRLDKDPTDSIMRNTKILIEKKQYSRRN